MKLLVVTSAVATSAIAATSAADPASPAIYDVHCTTDIAPMPGAFTLHVNRSQAPLGADRLYALVNDGFYNASAIYRVYLPHVRPLTN